MKSSILIRLEYVELIGESIERHDWEICYNLICVLVIDVYLL